MRIENDKISRELVEETLGASSNRYKKLANIVLDKSTGVLSLEDVDDYSDVDINKLVEAHSKSGKLVTLTAVQPTGRFGAIDILEDNAIGQFKEKPVGDGNWINGGFFVCENEAFDYIPENDPSITWERTPLQSLAKISQLYAYKHYGFWHPMDMLKDKLELNELWEKGKAPWKKWE